MKNLKKNKIKKGFFITFEGPEGSGKSTQVNLLNKFLKKNGFNVLVTREPGGSAIGCQIRKIILKSDNTLMTGMCELFLYLADRAQHVEEVINPALRKDMIVISDRYSDATIAYQGKGRTIGTSATEKLNKLATGNLVPDITFLLDIKASKGLKNATKIKSDRMENESITFHNNVRKEYLKLQKKYPKRIKLIKRDTIENVAGKINTIIMRKLK